MDNNNLNYFTSYIFIIIAIILAIPMLPYLITMYMARKGGATNDEHLITAYETQSKSLDIFNTFDEIHLFCTYVLFRRVKVCDEEAGENKELYNAHLSDVFDTLELIKGNLDGTINAIEELKKKALAAIIANRKTREDREHTEYIENMKEYNANARHSSDNRRKWIVILLENFRSFFVAFFEGVAFAIKMIVEVVRLIVPAIAALLRNPVFVGFIILVWFIYFILGLIKEALDKKKEREAEANKDVVKDEADVEGSNSYLSFFKDIIDTYNYFMNMLKNFKMSSTGFFGNAGDENDTGQIDREEIKGNSYDNLSYIMLSDVFAKDEISQYFGDVSIDDNKYYNVLLPDERFKIDAGMSLIKGKWKVMKRVENKNEKVWRIDCDTLDKVIRKDKEGKAIGNDIPAYLSDSDGKCSINQTALAAYHKSLIPEKVSISLSTEGIR